MNVSSLDQQSLLRISKIFIHCCLALLVEAALQVWAWKMLTSIPTFDNYPFIHLDRVSEEDSLWDFPYVIIFAFVCLSVSFGNKRLYQFGQTYLQHLLPKVPVSSLLLEAWMKLLFSCIIFESQLTIWLHVVIVC